MPNDLDEQVRQYRQSQLGRTGFFDDVLRDLGTDPITGQQIPTYLDKQLEIDEAQKALKSAMDAGKPKPSTPEGDNAEQEPVDTDILTEFKTALSAKPGSDIGPSFGATGLRFGANVAKNVLTRSVATLEDLWDSWATRKNEFLDTYYPKRQMDEIPTTKRALSEWLNKQIKTVIPEPLPGLEKTLVEIATIVAPGLAAGKQLTATAAGRVAGQGASAFVYLDPDEKSVLDSVHALPPIMQDDLARFQAGKITETEYTELVRRRMERRSVSGMIDAATSFGIEMLVKFGKALKHAREVKRTLSQYPDLSQLGKSAIEPTAAGTAPKTLSSEQSLNETLEAFFGAKPTRTVEEFPDVSGAAQTGPTMGARSAADFPEFALDPSGAATTYETLDAVQKAVVDQLTSEIKPHFGDASQAIAVGAVLGTGIFATKRK